MKPALNLSYDVAEDASAEDGVPMSDKMFAKEIAAASARLAAGVPLSVVAQELHEQGYGGMPLLAIVWRSSGMSLGDAKELERWWSASEGVTDVESFDAWAAEAILRRRKR